MKDSETPTSLPTIALVPWEKNPRKNDAAVDKVAASIQELGFGAPIVAQAGTNRIIAGHTRWKAAQKLGLDEVPVRLIEISDEKATAMTLADNKLAEISNWDDEALRSIASDLDVDLLNVAGFERVSFLTSSDAEEPSGVGGISSIDIDSMELKHTCPRCGFEFDKGGQPENEEESDEG